VNKAQTIEYKAQVEESDDELLASLILELRRRFDSRAREVILPMNLDWDIPGVSITVPQRGDKKKLLELSERNVKQYKVDKYKQSERLNPDQRMMQTLGELKDLLHLEHLPMHIECFENSNIQGSDPVAACVVFKRAVPSKKDYRKFHIKSVDGPDDYASMREVTFRRYSRLMSQGEALPDLIIEDVIRLHAQYKCKLWFVETVQFQEFLKDELVKRSAAKGIPVPARAVKPIAAKAE